MIVNFDVINKENGFSFHNVNFCGESAVLVLPNIDVKWNKNNLWFRSVIFNSSFDKILSCGFPKFFNWFNENEFENPDCYPDPRLFNDHIFQEKCDGSLVICDYVNGQFSMRIRGTASYKTLENPQDFEVLLKKYPIFIDICKSFPDTSFLLEIVTPNKLIILPYSEVDFYLLGAVNKNKMEYQFSVDQLKEIAEVCGIKTPKRYTFNDINSVTKIVKEWEKQEGIVISYNEGKNKLKVKSLWYLFRHRIRSKLNIFEYYIQTGMLDYQDFCEKMNKDFDWEIAKSYQDQILKLTEARNRVEKILNEIKKFVESVKSLPTRKEQARQIISAYSKSGLDSIAFSILDGKELTNEEKAKLMRKVLKK